MRDKPWNEITFVGIDNSHPPQFWAWAGSRDETAEPFFRVTQAELSEQWNVMQSDLATLTAERDVLQRQLAIAVEFVQASDQADLQSYAEKHNIPLSAGWWTQSCARRCLDLIAADAARGVE